MKIHIYQVIVGAIAAFMIFQGTRNFIRGKSGQTLLKLFIRIFVWGGMLIIAVYPNIITMVAKILGIIDNMNAVILIGFLFVFLMMFKLLSAIEKLEQNVSELARNDSLKIINQENK